MKATTHIEAPLPPDLGTLTTSFVLSLRAKNRTPKTITVYTDAIRLLDQYLEAKRLPRAVAQLRKEHLQQHIADILAEHSAGYAGNRYRSLQQFFRWCAQEEIVEVSPMAGMEPPKQDTVPPPVLTLEQVRALLKACAGKDFVARRDNALVYLLYDTGMRLGELAGAAAADLDMGLQVLHVMGKGRKARSCPFGYKTAQALDRYLRARGQHKDHALPWLWLGRKGQLTSSGIAQALEERAEQAGIGHIHPHQFRHTAAHEWLAGGGQETDALRLFGWSSRQMLERYGASVADERARSAHRQIGLADRL